MAKSRVFWITRDKADCTQSDKVFVWNYRDYPKKYPSGIWRSEEYDPVLKICAIGFRLLTGLILNPGQRVKARLVIKENER